MRKAQSQPHNVIQQLPAPADPRLDYMYSPAQRSSKQLELTAPRCATPRARTQALFLLQGGAHTVDTPTPPRLTREVDVSTNVNLASVDTPTPPRLTREVDVCTIGSSPVRCRSISKIYS